MLCYYEYSSNSVHHLFVCSISGYELHPRRWTPSPETIRGGVALVLGRPAVRVPPLGRVSASRCGTRPQTLRHAILAEEPVRPEPSAWIRSLLPYAGGGFYLSLAESCRVKGKSSKMLTVCPLIFDNESRWFVNIIHDATTTSTMIEQTMLSTMIATGAHNPVSN